jgi:hypothetical protein
MDLTGWQPIDTAPRGSFSKKKGLGLEYDYFVPHWVDTWKEGGEVIRSYLIESGDRWAGYTRTHPPTHWRPAPQPQPEVTQPQGEP